MCTVALCGWPSLLSLKVGKVAVRKELGLCGEGFRGMETFHLTGRGRAFPLSDGKGELDGWRCDEQRDGNSSTCGENGEKRGNMG